MMKRNEPKSNPVRGGGWRRMPMAATTALSLFAASLSTHAGYSLQGLGFLSGGSDSIAYDVSTDGTTVVGQTSATGWSAQAFKWTSAGGMSGLGDLPGGSDASVAYGVNDDGSVIVGKGTAGTVIQAFTYSGTSMVNLGGWPSGTDPTMAFAVDGGVTVGTATAGWDSAVSYNSGSWNDLGRLFFAGVNTANAVTAPVSGSTVIVGTSQTNIVGLKDRAFRKVGSAPMEDLGTLGGVTAKANDVSDDGSTVVGKSSHNLVVGSPPAVVVDEAFVWDSTSTTMSGLGDLGSNDGLSDDFNSEAFGISADGQVIVGSGQTGLGAEGETGFEAFVYFQNTGTMELLSSVLSANGVSIAGWQQLLTAYSVSDVFGDGKTYAIAGVGINSSLAKEAFYATVELPAAVPEPQAVGLVAGVTLLGMAFWRRRHRQSGGR